MTTAVCPASSGGTAVPLTKKDHHDLYKYRSPVHQGNPASG